jgi:uncharacterized repeat protein (TIGR03803 family)
VPSYPSLLAQGRDGNIYGTTSYGGTLNYGTVFRWTPAGTYTVIHNFDKTTGEFPRGGLILGRDGNFYGTAQNGGAYNVGTIFRITPSGVVTVLHDFAGGTTDGDLPMVPPVQATDGNFYGLAPVAQITSTRTGVMYRITPTGVYTILTTLLPDSSFSAPLIQAADGNFYSTTYRGGINDAGTIFRVSRTGVVKVIYNFDGTHGGYGYSPVVQDASGYLFGVEAQGGSPGGGVVFKSSTAGALTVLHNFVSQQFVDGCTPAGGLVLATDNNFYGSTYHCGASGDGILFKISRAGAYTLLHNFDGIHGAFPEATAMQHTNGKIYGFSGWGGAYSNGVLYSLDVSLIPFVSLMATSGKAGQTVQILGQNFLGATLVKFGSGSASFTAASDTYMTAVVPAGGSTGSVTVTTSSGTFTSSKMFKVIPAINSFSPTSGTVGSQVVLAGTGLTQTNKITFGGVKATSFTVNSGTQVTVTVPVGALTGKIVVTTPGGSASKGTFTVH